METFSKRLSKQSKRWWFETPSCFLWRHRNVSWYAIDVCSWSTCLCVTVFDMVRPASAYVKAVAPSLVMIMQIPVVPLCYSHLHFLIAIFISHCMLHLMLLWIIFGITEGQIRVSFRCPSLPHYMFYYYGRIVCHVHWGNKPIWSLIWIFIIEVFGSVPFKFRHHQIVFFSCVLMCLNLANRLFMCIKPFWLSWVWVVRARGSVFKICSQKFGFGLIVFDNIQEYEMVSTLGFKVSRCIRDILTSNILFSV